MTTKPVPVRVAPTISRGKSEAGGVQSAPVLGSANDIAHYIATLAASLEQLAATRGLSFMAYLLGMVVEEARRIMAAHGSATHSDTETQTR